MWIWFFGIKIVCNIQGTILKTFIGVFSNKSTLFINYDYDYSMILVYKGHSTAGSQTGLRLDRWVAWHDLGRCTTIWTEDASRNERKSQAKKSTRRKTDRYTILVYANHTEVTYTTIMVFLVVATISATIDSGLCGSFSSLRLTLCEKKISDILYCSCPSLICQRMRKSVTTYSLNKFYTSSLISGFIKLVQFSWKYKKSNFRKCKVKLIKNLLSLI